MRYLPTSPNNDRHLTVFIDAGHGGPDTGATGTTSSGQEVHEGDLTLPVTLDASDQLRAAGFTVVVSRTSSSTVTKVGPGDLTPDQLLTFDAAHRDVAARDVCANEAHADLLVGVYFDGGSSSNAGSVTGYDTARPFAPSNERFANLLQGDVLSAMNGQGWQIPDEGAVTDDDLGSTLNAADIPYKHLLLLGPAQDGYFTTPSQMPGALIEPLYVTDPFEASIAVTAHGQQVIAGGIGTAVEQYFAPPPPPPPAPHP